LICFIICAVNMYEVFFFRFLSTRKNMIEEGKLHIKMVTNVSQYEFKNDMFNK
jgi:hypothetical protein